MSDLKFPEVKYAPFDAEEYLRDAPSILRIKSPQYEYPIITPSSKVPDIPQDVLRNIFSLTDISGIMSSKYIYEKEHRHRKECWTGIRIKEIARWLDNLPPGYNPRKHNIGNYPLLIMVIHQSTIIHGTMHPINVHLFECDFLITDDGYLGGFNVTGFQNGRIMFMEQFIVEKRTPSSLLDLLFNGYGIKTDDVLFILPDARAYYDIIANRIPCGIYTKKEESEIEIYKMRYDTILIENCVYFMLNPILMLSFLAVMSANIIEDMPGTLYGYHKFRQFMDGICRLQYYNPDWDYLPYVYPYKTSSIIPEAMDTGHISVKIAETENIMEQIKDAFMMRFGDELSK